MSVELTPENFYAWMKEDLCEELQEWTERHPIFGTMLRHPLVYDLGGVNPGLANRRLEEKIKMRDEALADKNWWKVVWCHERPWRVWALMEYVMPEFGPEGTTVWEIPNSVAVDVVLDIWMDSENIEQHQEEWLSLFSGRPDYNPVLGNAEELEWFDSLPDPITVYRGDPANGDNFLSWTTKEETAKWFAKRFVNTGDPTPAVVSATKPKSDFFAAITRRGESELLAFPT